nr:LOW QUALITY PROTEIN: lipid droplet-regulating VLDL assembly factor AUP1-like [Dermatophagoides farinae]
MSTNQENSSLNNQNNSKYPIEKLFDLKRIKSSHLWLTLYSPLGLCLFIIRFFIFLYVLFVSSILPHSSTVRRSLFFILGISITVDEEYFRKLKAKFLVANHISDLDPVILNLLMPCAAYVNSSSSRSSSANNQPCYISWLCRILKRDDDGGGDGDNNVYELSTKNIPIVCFPEQSKTNGRFGLFKFTSCFYHHDSLVHMVFLQTKRPFFNVSISPLGGHWLADLFWILFLPVTIFKVKHLGTLEKEETETFEQFLQRIQSVMASKTGLQATDYCLHDKREFIKRLLTEENFKRSLLSTKNSAGNNNRQKQQQQQSTNKQNGLKIDEYSQKVKEILPQVPLNVIKEDIAITNNIDDTVERILNGVVKFEPEPQQQQQQSSSSVNDHSIQSTLNTNIKISAIDNKNFAAKTFGKTSSERVSSFQERKEQMYRMARIRYLRKRGLVNNSNLLLPQQQQQ